MVGGESLFWYTENSYFFHLSNMIKYLNIILSVGIIGIVFLVVFYLVSSRAVNEVNTQVPPGFSFSRQQDVLPEDKLLAGKTGFTGQVDTELILAEPVRDVFWCKKTKDDNQIYAPEKIPYFKFAPGKIYGFLEVSGGWSERYAVACQTAYFIVDAADSFGFKMYGPFSKQ